MRSHGGGSSRRFMRQWSWLWVKVISTEEMDVKGSMHEE